MIEKKNPKESKLPKSGKSSRTHKVRIDSPHDNNSRASSMCIDLDADEKKQKKEKK